MRDLIDLALIIWIVWVTPYITGTVLILGNLVVTIGIMIYFARRLYKMIKDKR